MNLLSLPLLGSLLKSKLFWNALRILTLTLFLSALFAGWIFPEKENRFTPSILWGLFWPFTMIVSLGLFGPLFCSICPHAFVGRMISPSGKVRALPRLLSSPLTGLIALFSSYWVWVYLAPGLYKTPVAASLFFGVYTLIALVGFRLYSGSGYCSSLCPVGLISETFGKIGFLRIGTESPECSRCRDRECRSVCYRGLSPFTFSLTNNSKGCTLCMECAFKCDSVRLEATHPLRSLLGPIRNLKRAWGITAILLTAFVTVGMGLHHGIGRTALGPHLPWNIAAEWLQSRASIPEGLDPASGFALLSSLALTFALSLGGIALASCIAKTSFSRSFQELSLAFAPLVVVGAMDHMVSFFFVKTAPEVVNGFLWIAGSESVMAPLASMRDPWLRIFSLFTILSILFSFLILWNRSGILTAGRRRRVAITLVAGALPLGVFLLFVLRTAAFALLGAGGGHVH